jgi:hypothetical protein
MPRRALFCPTCTELLDRLEKAAEAVLRKDAAFQPIRERTRDDGLDDQDGLRSRYLEIKERAQEHLEAHADSGSAGPRCFEIP